MPCHDYAITQTHTHTCIVAVGMCLARHVDMFTVRRHSSACTRHTYVRAYAQDVTYCRSRLRRLASSGGPHRQRVPGVPGAQACRISSADSRANRSFTAVSYERQESLHQNTHPQYFASSLVFHISVLFKVEISIRNILRAQARHFSSADSRSNQSFAAVSRRRACQKHRTDTEHDVPF